MRTRSVLAAFAFAAILAAPHPLTAQAVRLPDSLEWTRLPSDPADFPAKVMAGEKAVRSLYHAGCPSDGGYAGAAHDALIEAAETDLLLRGWVALDHGISLENGECPSDLPRYEALLVKWVWQEWEDGLLDRIKAEGPHPTGPWLLHSGDLAHGTDPATYELLRGIARDPNVFVECTYGAGCHRDGFTLDYRRDATRSMLAFRINGGMGEAEAVKAVEADLAGAPPVLDWRPEGR